MTREEFDNKIKSKTRFEKTGYLFQCAGIVIFSLVMIYVTRNGPGDRFFAYMFSILLLTGCTGFYKLISKYKIVSFYDLSPVAIKTEIILDIFKKLPITQHANDDGVFHFTYQKTTWHIDYEFDLFCDARQFSFIAIGRGYKGGGLIDFGRAKRIKKILLREIQAELRNREFAANKL